MTAPDPKNTNIELGYQTVDLRGKGSLHVRLAGIFNLVMGGLDLVYALYTIFVGAFMYAIFTGKLGPTPPPPGASGMVWLMTGIHLGYAVCSFAVAPVKIIAGYKLLRGGRNARSWAYVAGCAGCVQIWCSVCCVIPMACGVYTIVAMSLDTVRAYMAGRDAGRFGVKS